MAAVVVLAREVKCYLCGGVSGRLIRRLGAPASLRPVFQPSRSCPGGPRFVAGRMVCCFCGGSLFLDATEEEFHETQKVYPRERRGRPPRSARQDAGGG